MTDGVGTWRNRALFVLAGVDLGDTRIVIAERTKFPQPTRWHPRASRTSVVHQLAGRLRPFRIAGLKPERLRGYRLHIRVRADGCYCEGRVGETHRYRRAAFEIGLEDGRCGSPMDHLVSSAGLMIVVCLDSPPTEMELLSNESYGMPS